MGRAATIVATASVVPEHRLPQIAVRQTLEALLADAPERRAALAPLWDRARVCQRYSVLPLDRLRQRRGLGESMALYREHAVGLGRRAATQCLARAGAASETIDLIITASCTGVMLPSLDAHLANQLGLRPDVRRLPINELGCAAGAAALAHAADFLAARPDARALVVSVELPSLSFQREDLRLENLIATALFGDGAAAALLAGRRTHGVEVLGTRSQLVPGSLDALGFELRDDGFHVLLGRQLPALVRGAIGPAVDGLLEGTGLARRDLAWFALHPGGPRILEAVAAELGLGPEAMEPSWAVLRDYGNLSSASVLFALDRLGGGRPPPAGAHGLLAAFGPGLSAELLLLRWS